MVAESETQMEDNAAPKPVKQSWSSNQVVGPGSWDEARTNGRAVRVPGAAVQGESATTLDNLFAPGIQPWGLISLPGSSPFNRVLATVPNNDWYAHFSRLRPITTRLDCSVPIQGSALTKSGLPHKKPLCMMDCIALVYPVACTPFHEGVETHATSCTSASVVALHGVPFPEICTSSEQVPILNVHPSLSLCG